MGEIWLFGMNYFPFKHRESSSRQHAYGDATGNFHTHYEESQVLYGYSISAQRTRAYVNRKERCTDYILRDLLRVSHVDPTS